MIVELLKNSCYNFDQPGCADLGASFAFMMFMMFMPLGVDCSELGCLDDRYL